MFCDSLYSRKSGEIYKDDFMTTEFILSQVFICISAVIYSTSLVLKTKQKMLIMQMCSSVFYVSHYFLLKANLAGFVAVFETIRLFAFFFLDKNEKFNTTLIRVCACVMFSVLSIVAAVFTWDGLSCLLPLIATIIVNITLSIKNVLFYKVGAMIYATLIIIYLFVIGSILGGISQSLALVFSIIGLIKAIKNEKENYTKSKNQNNNELSSANQNLLKEYAQPYEENKKISL